MNRLCKSVLLSFSFTIAAHSFLSENAILATTPLEPPVLIVPLESETNASIPVVLKWYMSPEVGSYELQLLNDNEEEIYVGEIEISTEHSLEGKIAIASLNEEIVNYYGIYYWRVKAKSRNGESEWSELWSFAIQDNAWQIEEDDDDDGIPNSVEYNIYHTNPAIKTLFICPMKETNNGMIYWEEFITMFPDPDSRPGFADIPALSKAGIEVVVIGCAGSNNGSGTNCHTYQPFDDFEYNPASNQLPCDIMRIVYKKVVNDIGEGIFCAASSKQINGVRVKGHTYFDNSNTTIQNGSIVPVPTWSWDIKGYTQWSQINDGYYIPWVFPFPLDNYFKEGAYSQIGKDEIPSWINGFQAIEFKGKSPMNLNDNDPDPDPPFTDGPDLTVEFNRASYQGDGKILSFELSDVKNNRAKVLRRTIAHEIGHALLGPDNGNEHCSNPHCIMFKYTLDWEMRGFGDNNSSPPQGEDVTTSCEHAEGERLDIRATGMVHNNIHTNLN